MFEPIIRDLIAKSDSKVVKSVLKVVLGDFQTKNAKGTATDKDGFAIIEKIMTGNLETIGYLSAEDPRRQVLIEENECLATLLPKSATVEEVLAVITDEMKNHVALAKNDGMATGILVKFAKAQGLNVKGDTAREAVSRIRC